MSISMSLNFKRQIIQTFIKRGGIRVRAHPRRIKQSLKQAKDNLAKKAKDAVGLDREVGYLINKSGNLSKPIIGSRNVVEFNPKQSSASATQATLHNHPGEAGLFTAPSNADLIGDLANNKRGIILSSNGETYHVFRRGNRYPKTERGQATFLNDLKRINSTFDAKNIANLDISPELRTAFSDPTARVYMRQKILKELSKPSNQLISYKTRSFNKKAMTMTEQDSMFDFYESYLFPDIEKSAPWQQILQDIRINVKDGWWK